MNLDEPREWESGRVQKVRDVHDTGAPEPAVGTDAAAGGAGGRNPFPVRSPMYWIRDTRALAPRERWLSLAGAAGVALLFCSLVVVYGLLPGLINTGVDIYGGGGIGACGARDFPAHLFTCPNIGYPGGYQSATGGPPRWLASLFQWLGADVVNASRLVWLVVLGLSFWGARRFFARVTTVGPLAWFGTVAFLVSPIVAAQGGYGPMQLGFMLVPVYLLMDLRVAEGLDGSLGRRALAGRMVSLIVVRTLGLMIDPYSFIVALVGVVVFWLVWAIRALRSARARQVLVAAAVVVVSVIVAYVLYGSSVETAGFKVVPLDYFRGSGVDLYALVVPSTSVWLDAFIGLHHNIGPLQAYSDGHNLNDVYIGVPMLAVAAVGLFASGRRVGLGVRLVAGAAGLITLLLTFGPSIRIDDFRLVAANAPITYTMPAADATLSSPWSFVYQNVPAISIMRAVWRWELGVRLALVVLAVLGLTWWVRRTRSWRTRWIPALVAVLLIAESVPNLPQAFRGMHTQLGGVRAVEALVTTPLTGLVTPGDRAILYGPHGISPGSNDYMANFICSVSDLRCYNAGGDKALGNSLSEMPAVARQILVNHVALGDKGVQQKLLQMFAANQLDAVVLVNFDLAAQASSWPPTEKVRSTGVDAGLKMFVGVPGFTRVDTPYFTLIKKVS